MKTNNCSLGKAIVTYVIVVFLVFGPNVCIIGAQEPVPIGEATPQAQMPYLEGAQEANQALVDAQNGLIEDMETRAPEPVLPEGPVEAFMSIPIEDPQCPIYEGPLPQLFDTDGDGIYDACDVNGDGRIDAELSDLDGDGIKETWVGEDGDGDGRIDLWGVDADGNGTPDGWSTDGDGIIDVWILEWDIDGDGTADTFFTPPVFDPLPPPPPVPPLAPLPPMETEPPATEPEHPIDDLVPVPPAPPPIDDISYYSGWDPSVINIETVFSVYMDSDGDGKADGYDFD